MRALIIYAHPWDGSFNHAILESVQKGLADGGHESDLIDLVEDGFNPVFTAKELALYRKGESLDPLVKDYQERIKKADNLFILFPNWWGGMPAVLKGFIDKVFLRDFAYKDNPGPGNGLLDIKKAAVITTFESPSIGYHLIFKSHIKKNIAFQILKWNGVKSVKIFPIFRVKSTTAKKRTAFLEKIERFAKNLK